VKNIIFENYDSKTKSWLEQELNLTNEPTIDDYLYLCHLNEDIEKVGDIVPDDSIKPQYRTIVYDKVRKHAHWVYILVVGDKVVKCGDTTQTLNERFSSYSAGSRKARDRGTCSTTNYFVSEVIRKAHEIGYKVELYGYPIPPQCISADLFGESVECRVDIVTYYESELIKRFVNEFGDKPIIGKNGMVK
tara:strand:+ start:79 stop:648 length:570 start_codon:yes stop_codon:yes gene_type:complete